MEIFTADSFTKKPFEGNPAAVCILADKTPQYYKNDTERDELFQKIAREMSLSETAFVTKTSVVRSEQDHEQSFFLQWFTPTNEVNLCGHATLAAAWILFFEKNSILKSSKVTELIFDTKWVGELRVSKERIDNGEYLLQLDFPLGNPEPISLDSSFLSHHLLPALYSKSQPMDSSIVEEVAICKKTKKLIIKVNSVQQILELKVGDLMSLVFDSQLQPFVKGIIVTCDQVQNTEYQQYDFISRYFSPWNGIGEDPVTGSAHTCLAPFYASKKNRNQLRAFQRSPRGGELFLEVKSNAGRILIKGFAVTVLRGSINIQ